MIRLLLGGSPCTYWSIAQKNNRETEASGTGWELFKNYLIAKEKFKPDYFLYENNVSAAQPIKDEIKKQFRVRNLFNINSDVEYIEINSALVSAQNRERFYVHNCGDVVQPKDRGILLKDVLIRGYDLTGNEKSYALTTRCNGAIPEDTLTKHRHNMVAEPVIFQVPHGYNDGGMKYGKAPTLTANGCWQENNKVIEPIRIPEYSNTDKSRPLVASYAYKGDGEGSLADKCFTDNPNKQKVDYIAEPVRVGAMPRPNGELSTSQALRVYSIDGKATTINHGGGGAGGKIHTVYEVKDGKITIKGKEYPIKLPDGFYIIRKLTVAECRRLQTIPDWCKMPCSDTQNYKMLGNGWTVEVIKHILSHIPGITTDPIEVLSMYDGMSCGQIALKELGANVVRYYATEIDKYAIQTTQANFPDTIQLGDAFQVRNKDWKIGE